MGMDMDNLAPAPDIENFDPKAGDRGDTVIVEEPKAVEPEPIVEEPKAEEPPVEEPPAEEPPAEEEPPRDEKGKFAAKGIPKARFDEAVGKEREAREAAERRANELERQLAATATQQAQSAQIAEIETAIEGMETKHAELLLDGDTAGAAKIMKEIRMAERQIARAETDAISSQRTTQALEKQRVDTAIARLEADHAPLNPDSESYDADLVELVLSKQRSLIQQEGLAPSEALTKAANTVMERFGKAPEVVDAKGLAAQKLAADRKAEQVRKNLETAAKQPASMKESGMDSDKLGATLTPDFSKMTQEEFAALPESTKAKARGDFI